MINNQLILEEDYDENYVPPEDGMSNLIKHHCRGRLERGVSQGSNTILCRKRSVAIYRDHGIPPPLPAPLV